MYCPHCYGEVSGFGDGDECLDFCSDCDVIVEGNTLLWGDVLEQFEKDQDMATEDWINLLSNPKPTLKYRRSVHLAELSVRMTYEAKVAWKETNDFGNEL